MSPGNELSYAGLSILPSEKMNGSSRELVMFEHEGNLIFENETLGAGWPVYFTGTHGPTDITNAFQGRTYLSAPKQTPRHFT